ncbi:DUF4395 domain-containing protein [Nonomuraea aurantiaca]|uniref:DUF4395 domain-containing protein n=1 Tax=Nonomuraea aurantiaca TaxID=2878562 RepID=UPI001CD925E6|nr:DUF4395 domain-containing protein [Nonomuraea aurantiaca]MCA2224718.1 DUF4395 domain-containing protein [Nonomuraea aurantiaca]
MRADPRALRFSAAITTAILALVLVTGSAWPTAAQVLLAAQALVFALGAAGRSPYAVLFKALVKSAPRETEDARPPRFAQGVGLGFAVVGLVGYLAGITPLALVATAAALLAAFLNAAFGFCLGCETYLLIRRLLPAAKLEVPQ